jgi:Holliday junction DNA helicase RuvB
MSSTPNTPPPERRELDAALRPHTFDEYVGQEQVKRNVIISVEAARMRGDMPEHFLFYGPPGIGKTTLAHLIATSLEKNVRVTSGVAIERAGDLAAVLTNLEEEDILFIDEIHRLPKKVEELLYPALESGSLDIILGKGPSARTVQLSLPRFTLIGATTHIAAVSAPLRSRFGGGIHGLELYTEEDIARIIRRSADILGVVADDDVFSRIASRSRRTPRTANFLLKRFRDYGTVHQKPLSSNLFDEACILFGIDATGLSKEDRKYLSTLETTFRGGPAGMRALASALHEDPETLEELYEPYLVEVGFVERTPRGRVLTDQGRIHLKKSTHVRT